MAESKEEIYDLLILVDATYSMSNYLTSLQTSLPKIISISELTDSFARIGLLAYRDYCDTPLLEWSGWMHKGQNNDINLVDQAKALESIGGGDYPEATKTGLAKAYDMMSAEATTVILLYTDAPPHTIANGTANGYTNHEEEQKALESEDSYGGTGHLFTDWVHGARVLAGKEGEKKAHVFSVLEPDMVRKDGIYYTLLSTITGGACFYLDSATPKDIAQVTVDLLLAWMGVGRAGAGEISLAAKLSRFKNAAGIEGLRKESNKKEKAVGTKEKRNEKEVVNNTEELAVTSTVLREHVPQRAIAVKDFAARYKTDEKYKALVGSHLQKIINEDVSAIALNPVFGTLWRTICNDRDNPEREVLTTVFSLQVDKISNADEKLRMKNWLEESYDYSAVVKEIIETVPEEKQFPCVFLDPTQDFGNGNDENDEDNRPITSFRRDELLEIGRSCDYKILRRLGKVLTRLSFVEKAEDLPAYIASAGEGIATQVPLALASKEFGRKFWRILLHIIVPGTMLSARPAALLAALSIHMGVHPLFEAAEMEMLGFKAFWNNIETPETWNVGCLSLLLDADRAYLARKGEDTKKGLLRADDKELFKSLTTYKMLELNMRTTLTALVTWKPEKTVMSIGPVVECRSCHYPRSVTIMGEKGKCGGCLAKDYPSPEEREKCINENVSKSDTDVMNISWVECGTRTCRVQYVVYRPHALNVRAKCHFCRLQSSVAVDKRNLDPAPYLECKICLAKVIFPEEYRTAKHTNEGYKCVACEHGTETVVKVETTAQQLVKENGRKWLIHNTGDKLKDPLGGGSLFKQISAAGIDNFCQKVILFPDRKKDNTILTLNGKPVQNVPALVHELKTWISRRRTESGTCSLCFSDFKKGDLNPACGRRNCDQLVCQNCLKAWYGLNRPGSIINIAALSCAFCRRAPTAQRLHKYGMGIHAVGDLKNAVRDRGKWVYAWCTNCALAKPYLERVCAAGAPAELTNWSCEPCVRAKEEEELEAALALQEELKTMRRRGRAIDHAMRMEAMLAAERAERAENARIGRVKACPGCEVMVERFGGCGHITCVCGAEWCWFCRKNFKRGLNSLEYGIYDHFSDVHGGFFGEGEE